jgi:hypothetical protein
MSNNKKKANKPKQENGTVETKKPVETMPTSITAPGILTKAQLTMLILLSIGVSRLLRVKTAFVKTETGEPSTTCIEHLSEEACQDDAVHALLQYKYQTGLQTTLLVLAGMLQCWNSEQVLQRYHALFLVSPMATGLLALHLTKEWVSSAHIWKQLM